MNLDTVLGGQTSLPHENPQKLIFMLHGYGDSAENFIHIAKNGYKNTAGCIAVNKKDLKKIIKIINKKTNVYID